MYTSSLFILLVSMVSVMAVPTPSDDPPPDPNASVLPYLLAPGVSLVAPDLIDVQSLDKADNDHWGGNATSWRFAFKDDYNSEHFSVSVLKEDDPTKVVQKLECTIDVSKAKADALGNANALVLERESPWITGGTEDIEAECKTV